MTDEQRKRIHDITYSTADRAELAERIVVLEEFIEDMNRELRNGWDDETYQQWLIDVDFEGRMAELGLEVKS